MITEAEKAEMQIGDHKKIKVHTGKRINLHDGDLERVQRVMEKNDVLTLRMKRIIFGRDQAFGIESFQNSLYVQTQWEPWVFPVHTFICFGPPASGKTVMAEALAQQIDEEYTIVREEKQGSGNIRITAETFSPRSPGKPKSKYTLVTGMSGMIPQDLIGYIDTKTGVHVPGIIKPGVPILIFDEISRATIEAFNTLAHILTSGKIPVGGEEIPIAPPGQPFIVLCTANLTSSAGTRELGNFLVDRIVCGALFSISKEKEDRLRLLFPRKHWHEIEELGILKPLLKMEDIVEMGAVFKEFTLNDAPEDVTDYMLNVLETVETLAEPRWAEKVQYVPDEWKTHMKNMPTDPFLRGLGGRMYQHFSTLAQADSFCTFHSLETTFESAQRMTRSFLSHRIMYQNGDGGEDILDRVFDGSVSQFLRSTIDWIMKLTPVHS